MSTMMNVSRDEHWHIIKYRARQNVKRRIKRLIVKPFKVWW